MENHAAGISMVAFIVAVAISMGYYQFVYLPQANAKPIVKEEILNPTGTAQITIVDGSSNPGNGRFFVPADIRAPLGEKNKVVWSSSDSTPHTVTTDANQNYKDQISGLFDSRERPVEKGGPYVMPGKTFEFLFTKAGEYTYHCEPHPWMKGKVVVTESFA